MLRRTLAAAWRRWYVVLLVLAVAAATAAAFHSRSGVYSARTTVAFTAPNETLLTPNSSAQSADFIAFAGAVAAEIVPDRTPVRYSESDAPYYGAGIRRGILVSLLDDGNQWDPSYRTAVVVIQIVGTSEQWVAERQQEAVARIEEATNARNGSAAPGQRVSARVDPLSLGIEHVMPSRFARVAAFGAIGLAAVLVAGWAALAVDRRHMRSDLVAPLAPTARKENHR